MTPSGTNLLGLVKHLAYVELAYFGDTFGRPGGLESPWHDDDAAAHVARVEAAARAAQETA